MSICNLGWLCGSAVMSVPEGHLRIVAGSWIWRSQDIPGIWGRPRGMNAFDGGAAFYDVYETQDGKFMSVGALEPQFFLALLQGQQCLFSHQLCVILYSVYFLAYMCQKQETKTIILHAVQV